MHLSASELGITEQQRDALIKTIDVLKAEQVVFTMGTSCYNPIVVSDGAAPACGTRACIGGTMGLIMANGGTFPERVTNEMVKSAAGFVDANDPWGLNHGLYDRNRSILTPLFYDNLEEGTTPADGIAAIERFLAGNKSDPWLVREGE